MLDELLFSTQFVPNHGIIDEVATLVAFPLSAITTVLIYDNRKSSFTQVCCHQRE
jgi:hypothetical protein